MKKNIVLSVIAAILVGLLFSGCEPDWSLLAEQSYFSAGNDVKKHVTDENFAQTAKGIFGGGATYYSSSNEGVATVNETTGEVEILSAGITFITAVNQGDGGYKPASDRYELTVTDTKIITTWSTDDSGVVTIPVYTEYDYDCVIDWGDGEITTETTKPITHQYKKAGTYTVSVSGSFPGFYFGAGAINGELITIENWGINKWKSMHAAFYFCGDLLCNAIDVPDLSNITDMSFMLANATSFNCDLSSCNVSGVLNMENIFYNAAAFNSDLSNWDVSSVTNMRNMFADAILFESDLSEWDVSNVTNMDSMFYRALSFKSDLSRWNVSNVTNMKAMFAAAASFNSSLSNWDVSNVADMSFMFRYASTFNSELNSWDVSTVTDMQYMFNEATNFNSSLSVWDVSNVTNMSHMFENASGFHHHNLSRWNIANVTDYTDFRTGWGEGDTEPVW